MDQLQQEYQARERATPFEKCRDFLISAREAERYAVVSKDLGISEGALRVAVHRMRESYRELLRQEVGGTLLDESQIDDEINSLRRSLEGD